MATTPSFDDVNTEFAELSVIEVTSEQQARLIVDLSVPPVLLILGLAGGVLSSVVLGNMARSVTPLCIHLLALSLVDIAVLLLEEGVRWTARVAGRDIFRDAINQSDTLCKTFYFLKHWTSHFSSWITVCVMIEAFMARKRPKEVGSIGLKHVVDTLIVLVVLLTLLNAHYFWTYGIDYVDMMVDGSPRREKFCMFNGKDLQGYQDDPVIGDILAIIHWVVADAVPMAVVLVLLIWTCVVPRRTRRTSEYRDTGRENLLSSHPEGKKQYKDCNPSGPLNELLDKTVVYLSVAFLLFTFPYFVCRPLNRHFSGSGNMDPMINSDRTDPKWALVTAVFWQWKMTFYSARVLLYAWTSCWFRRAAGHLMTSPCRRCRALTMERPL